MNRFAAVLGSRSFPVHRSFSELYESWEDSCRERLVEYFESFADKVENDTLSFREGAAVFALGGLCLQTLTWVASLIF